MSINPVSDIVLDVAQAADPAQFAAATQRLSRLGASDQAGAAFSGVLDSQNSGEAALRGQLGVMGTKHFRTASSPSDARTKALKGIEQLVLKNLVEAMLPQEESGLFGAGSAGEIWRSMLADELARQLGSSVDLGVVKSALKQHAATGQQTQAPAAAEVSLDERSKP